MRHFAYCIAAALVALSVASVDEPESFGKTIAVIGATGGLGSRIVQRASELGYHVNAILRDGSKAAETLPLLPEVEHRIVPSFHPVNFKNLVEALTEQEYVVEVIDNEDRLEKVETIIRAVVEAKVQNFIVCGGAGVLKASDEKNARHLFEELEGSVESWFKPVSELHLKTQNLAFSSDIPVVAQLAPPAMSPGERTGTFTTSKDFLGVGGMDPISYEDVADVLMQALPNIKYYNRAVIGVRKTLDEL